LTQRASENPELDFKLGDHVCAFYNGGGTVLDDIVVDYLSRGLRDGHKCFCMVDSPASVRGRIAPELQSRAGSLKILTEDEAYMPDGHFSKEGFIAAMETMVHEAFAEGYDRFRAVGDESFIVRNSVDIKEWFAAEAELNKIVPDFPHFFFCLYDLDLFDGDTVMYVLRTHPRIYVNGLVITNPHYVPVDRLAG
jgi:hypothetical protein